MSAVPGSFYYGKVVLVTGHTGFKGGWLTAWLTHLGARAVGFSLPPERGRPGVFETAEVGRDVVSVFGDLRDFSSLERVFNAYAPEIVFHMAAQALVRRSYREPVETYATNVMGTVHVLEAVRRSRSVRAVVNVTSDKCYENQGWVWGYREGEPMGGRDPYSSSKACAELVTAAYRKSFFRETREAAVASVRAGNVIGGGDWADERLVPDIVRAISNDTPIVLRNPHATRPWQHVLEPIRGYLMLGERLLKDGEVFAEAWNFGPRDEDVVSVRELTEMILRHWGRGELVTDGAADGLHEARDLKLDCSKAHARLGWRPALNLEAAAAMTVAWYRTYLENRRAAARLVVEQIERYAETLTG